MFSQMHFSNPILTFFLASDIPIGKRKFIYRASWYDLPGFPGNSTPEVNQLLPPELVLATTFQSLSSHPLLN